MTGEPLVSVIIPAHNAAATLAETLRSVARQSYRDLEIVIVDDGSTDATAAIAAEFCSSEPRARLVRTGNRGVSAARNRAIAESRGEWIAPIDADDLWHPSKIEKQVRAALAEREPPGFVYCWYRQVDEEGRLLASGPRVRLTGAALRRLAYINAVENGSAPLFSKAALVAVGGYDEDLRAYEDPLVQLRIARRCPVALVPEHLVGWRRHEANTSSDVDLIASTGRTAYARLLAEGAPLPRRVVRWVAARNALDTAEERLLSGHPGKAVKALGAALAGDPLRTALQVAHRIARIGKKRLGRRSRPAPLPLFAEVDPAEPIDTDAFAVPALARLGERLDQRRLRNLGAIDSKTPLSDAGEQARKLPGIDIADAEPGQGKEA